MMGLSPVAREAERDRCLKDWASVSGVELAELDVGQRWVAFAALTFLAFAGRLAPLRRMVAYLLSHSGLGLSSVVIGAVVGTTDRAVRKGRQFAPREFWTRLQKAKRGHAPAKLRKDQVGLVAKFLAEHKHSSVAELLGFIQKTFDVQMDRLTLRRFLKRYGLGCLRDETVEDTPFLPDAPATEARSL
jgi:transposase